MNSIDRLQSLSFADRAASNKRLLEDLKLPGSGGAQPDKGALEQAKTLIDTVNISREAAKTLTVNLQEPKQDTKSVDRARIDAQISNTRLQFEVSTPGQVVVKLVDVNGEVIRQMPPEVAIELAKSLKETASKLARESIGEFMGYGGDQQKLDELFKKATPEIGSIINAKA